jgi:hypothetical protein
VIWPGIVEDRAFLLIARIVKQETFLCRSARKNGEKDYNCGVAALL